MLRPSVPFISPGTIETKGGTRSGRWFPQAGQRLVGSSMISATLKLVQAMVRNEHYWAVEGTQFIWDFHAENFTVDCNSEGQLSPYVSCGAIVLVGSAQHCRIRRVRAIHFGSHAPDLYVENFVFGLA